MPEGKGGSCHLAKTATTEEACPCFFNISCETPFRQPAQQKILLEQIWTAADATVSQIHSEATLPFLPPKVLNIPAWKVKGGNQKHLQYEAMEFFQALLQIYVVFLIPRLRLLLWSNCLCYLSRHHYSKIKIQHDLLCISIPVLIPLCRLKAIWEMNFMTFCKGAKMLCEPHILLLKLAHPSNRVVIPKTN